MMYFVSGSVEYAQVFLCTSYIIILVLFGLIMVTTSNVYRCARYISPFWARSRIMRYRDLSVSRPSVFRTIADTYVVYLTFRARRIGSLVLINSYYISISYDLHFPYRTFRSHRRESQQSICITFILYLGINQYPLHRSTTNSK